MGRCWRCGLVEGANTLLHSLFWQGGRKLEGGGAAVSCRATEVTATRARSPPSRTEGGDGDGGGRRGVRAGPPRAGVQAERRRTVVCGGVGWLGAPGDPDRRGSARTCRW